jgi:hypothetical protein
MYLLGYKLDITGFDPRQCNKFVPIQKVQAVLGCQYVPDVLIRLQAGHHRN